jgi:glycosyltransferase 2 family protein
VLVSDRFQPEFTARKTLRLAIQWLVPIVIIAIFLLTGQLDSAIHALAEVSPVWAIPLVIVGVALPMSHAWRWCFLLERSGARIRLVASARITSLASLINYAAPGFLGAPTKAILARNGHQIPISRSIPTLAIEQVLDAAALALAGFVSVLIAGPLVVDAMSSAISRDDTIIMVIGAIAVTAALFVALVIGRRMLPAFMAALREATTASIQSSAHRTPIALLTLTRWVLDMVAVGIASVAVGLRLGVFEILLLANLSLLAGLIAPVPGGLGVREAVMASIAGVIGVSIPAILALSVLHRAGLAIGLPIVIVASRLFDREAR